VGAASLCLQHWRSHPHKLLSTNLTWHCGANKIPNLSCHNSNKNFTWFALYLVTRFWLPNHDGIPMATQVEKDFQTIELFPVYHYI
jgi:hypothetical protein